MSELEFRMVEAVAPINYKGETFEIPYKAVIKNGFVADLKFDPKPEVIIAAMRDVSDLINDHAMQTAKSLGWVEDKEVED